MPPRRRFVDPLSFVRPAGGPDGPASPGQVDTTRRPYEPPTPDEMVQGGQPSRPRTLTVSVVGIANATVSVDNQPPRQALPTAVFANLDDTVDHALLVRADGRVDYRVALPAPMLSDTSIVVSPADMPLRALQVGAALLTVTSPTPGLRVFADNEAAPFSGSPPSRVLRAGAHTVTAKADGFLPVTRNVTITAGVPQVLTIGELPRAPSGLSRWLSGWRAVAVVVGVAGTAVAIGAAVGARRPAAPPPTLPPREGGAR